MKRISILLLLLMAFVAACGGGTSSPSATDTDTEPDPTAETTPDAEPSDEPSTEPGESDGGTGFEGVLADVIPDELNGVPRTEIPGMDTMVAQIFAGQNLDASEAQFAFASYGEGTDAVVLTAIAVPDVPDAQLEMLGRMFAGAGMGVEGETLNLSGKTVLRVSSAAQPGSVYMYFGGGAVFTIYSEDQGLAEQLLGELP